jgi:membrane-associated phospholipid phosphatase
MTIDPLIQPLKKGPIYFSIFGCVIVVCLLFLSQNSKTESFIMMNRGHTVFLDLVFNVFTFLGNGFFAIALALIFIFNNKTFQIGISILYAFFLSGILAQLIKTIVEAPRPKEVIDSSLYNFFTNDVRVGFNSFPSGHATTIFTIITILCVMYASKKIQIPLFIVAALSGYSRVYLGHHFLIDVIVGAILGTLIGIHAVYLFQKQGSNYSKSSFGSQYKSRKKISL